MTWICANCGAEHEANDPPCRQCAHEQFAHLDAEAPAEEIGETAHVSWACTDCGRIHPRNNPPCKDCGSMQFTNAGGGEAVTDGAVATTSEQPGVLSSAGDILFNKSLTRQLIDLELLIVTGLTWGAFLLSELIYHRWKTSKGEDTQYSYPGGAGEGLITKAAKVLFWLQVVLIVVGVWVLVA